MKKAILKATAKAGKAMAVKACGSASFFGYHQPKEPKIVKNLKK